MEWIGTVLEGRYELQSELGAGGMGSVFLARDVRLDRRVVVKIPHTDLLQDEQFRTRFLSEVRGMSRLEHLHVIKIHDAGEHDEVPFAVVQFVGGGDLRGRIPRGERQAPEETLVWAKPVASALDFIHGKNHVHRDVKPGNILFDSTGNPYLSDFGIATVMKNAEDTSGGQLTQVGTFVGSPVYSPPEALARELSPQYDQYSLAVVLYEAMTGQFPYEAKSATQVMGAKIRDEPRPLRELAPDVPEAVAAVVMKGLDRDPAGRYETCAAMVEALEQAVRQPAAAAPSSQATVVGGLQTFDPASTHPRRSPAGAATRPAWMLPAVGGAAVALAGLLAYFLLTGPETEPRPVPDESQTPVAGPETTPGTGTTAPSPPRSSEPVRFRGGATPDQLAKVAALCTTGCEPENFASEARRPAVVLTPFRLSETEVTASQFAEFVGATGHETQAEKSGFSHHGETPFGPKRSKGASWRAPDGAGSSWEDHPRQPAIHVSAADAEAFCAHRGMRLPTEEEWEYAARKDEGRLFPWGDDWRPDDVLWNGSQADPPSKGLRDVGSFRAGAGPFGQLDMAGSVWEWTATVSEDEHGDSRRVLKGGSWLDRNPAHLRTTVQLELYPDDTESGVGFRCAEDADAWPDS